MDQTAWQVPESIPAAIDFLDEHLLQQLVKEVGMFADQTPAVIHEGAPSLNQNTLQGYASNPMQQPCCVSDAPSAFGPRTDAQGMCLSMQSVIQSLTGQLAPSLPQVMQSVSSQLPRLPEISPLVQERQPAPALPNADAAQLAALVVALNHPNGHNRYVTSHAGSPGHINLSVSDAGRICKTSSADDYTGSVAHVREKNRQAQQRFRQRQKDRIAELELENKSLKDQLASSQQQLATACEEIKLLQAKIEGQLQALESIQAAQHMQQQFEIPEALQQPLPYQHALQQHMVCIP